jgi:hypothetical protein
MTDPIEEYCKNNIINTSLFKNSSAKFLDPNFDIKSFLCEVLKLTDLPNIDPVLEDNKAPIFPQQTDYSGLSSIGDPRVTLGLTLSVGFTNFMPRNIVYGETLKHGGSQVINNIVCDLDGNPIRISQSSSIENMEDSQKELEVFSILDSEEVKDTYPNYDFKQTICLEQLPLTIADLDKSIDNVDLETTPNYTPFTSAHNNLFVSDSTIDLCKKPLDLDSLFVPTTPEEYSKFTNDFIAYGREQHALYFIAFLKKFFINRGWTASIYESQLPPLFYVRLYKRNGNSDFSSTTTIVNKVTSHNYFSNVKYLYFKYWQDQSKKISELLQINEKTVNTTIGIRGSSSAMMRTIAESIPDYKRIMKDASLQKEFYKYSKKYYVETPQYVSTPTYTNNPTKVAFVV